MPYKSKAQQGLFHSKNSPVSKKVVAEFDAASKGQHGLPEHVAHGGAVKPCPHCGSKYADGGVVADVPNRADSATERRYADLYIARNTGQGEAKAEGAFRKMGERAGRNAEAMAGRRPIDLLQDPELRAATSERKMAEGGKVDWSRTDPLDVGVTQRIPRPGERRSVPLKGDRPIPWVRRPEEKGEPRPARKLAEMAPDKSVAIDDEPSPDYATYAGGGIVKCAGCGKHYAGGGEVDPLSEEEVRRRQEEANAQELPPKHDAELPTDYRLDVYQGENVEEEKRKKKAQQQQQPLKMAAGGRVPTKLGFASMLAMKARSKPSINWARRSIKGMKP